MKVNDLIEALKPSQYRSLVKGWDKEKYKNIFMNSKYKHDRNGYRVFIPIESTSIDRKQNNTLVNQIKQTLNKEGFDLIDYQKGLAQKKDTKQTIKLGKLLNKLKEIELLNKFNTDSSREGTKSEYMVVISRHPYDIAGMSTDRGWTSCMNLNDGSNRDYIPLDIKHGSVVAYVTKINDPDLKNPTGRIMIKPFVDTLGSNHIEFGIEDQVYGTSIPGFINAVNAWVNEVNSSNKLDHVVLLKIHPDLYRDFNKNVVKGGTARDQEQIRDILDDPESIQFIKNPSEQVQLAAITTIGRAIKYIKNPSERVQLAAVSVNGNAIQYIKNPSERVQLVAVNEYGHTVRHIKNPSEQVQIAAVSNIGYAIKHIKNPSEQVQIAAVTQNSHAIEYIKNPSERVQIDAVKQNSRAIKYIKNPSERIKNMVKDDIINS